MLTTCEIKIRLLLIVKYHILANFVLGETYVQWWNGCFLIERSMYPCGYDFNLKSRHDYLLATPFANSERKFVMKPACLSGFATLGNCGPAWWTSLNLFLREEASPKVGPININYLMKIYPAAEVVHPYRLM